MRTVTDLLDHLSNCMKKLEAKKMGVDEAKAQASLVKQANNLMRYELDCLKFENKLSLQQMAEQSTP